MNEIAPDPSFVAKLELAPLPPEALPPAVAKVLTGAAQARLMVTKGIAALRPAELLLAIYQLSFDPDEQVRAAAEAAPNGLPDKVVAASLAEALPAMVLHFFGERLAPSRTEAMEKLLFNSAVADETFVVLAGRLGEREMEIVFQNDQRLLRSPAIVKAAYFNKSARMSSLNRAIELCARNNVRVDGIPAFDEIAKSILADATATDPTVADQTFTSVLQATSGIEPEVSPADEADAAQSTRKSPIIDFGKLKLHEKIRLAMLGNAYCRTNLMRDPNRMVAMAAVRSPLITDNEIAQASANRALSEDVIRYIANQREYTKVYQIRRNLVFNPKTPVALSLKFLAFLGPDDMKILARSKNIPSALATSARRLLTTRNPGSG